ncbi:echA5 [Bugula neritina]|uniref:EchA5 n=1 Tax=Bugula neritina TaxID=10212 RepID=A0A7J7KU08_BUGNE|nr:echA5 [Bugula neritina]
MAGVTFMPLALGRNVMRNLHAPPPVLSNVGAFSRRCSFKDFSIPWASSHRTYSSHNGRNCIIQSQVGSIQMIAINRPHKRNAVDPETAKYLHEAMQDFEADENTSAAVLYGKDGVFCAGFDLSALASGGYQESLVSTVDDVQGPMGPTRFLCSKPVIAAIEGYAVAGGLELALWCDLRVMDETAILGVFCRRFGVPLVDGGTVRLPKLIGLSRALDLILTGREVRAKEALEIGLVNRVCDTGSGQ